MQRLILISWLIGLLSGCSVYKVVAQPGPADLTGIRPGTPRQELIGRLGAPVMVDTDQHGRKQDVFQFQSGFHHASKLRAIPYLAADVFTLTLAELVLWPLEITAMEAATCSGMATYDGSLKVMTWSVTKKNESNGMQDC
jgi:outer membrane protein assembly factor BamE (lipoprotein component of BamABCDE complex)